jgi:hypothetical protein
MPSRTQNMRASTLVVIAHVRLPPQTFASRAKNAPAKVAVRDLCFAVGTCVRVHVHAAGTHALRISRVGCLACRLRRGFRSPSKFPSHHPPPPAYTNSKHVQSNKTHANTGSKARTQSIFERTLRVCVCVWCVRAGSKRRRQDNDAEHRMRRYRGDRGWRERRWVCRWARHGEDLPGTRVRPREWHYA